MSARTAETVRALCANCGPTTLYRGRFSPRCANCGEQSFVAKPAPIPFREALRIRRDRDRIEFEQEEAAAATPSSS